MVSLAALKYADVLAEHGGPIERIDTGELSVMGEPHSLANAYLREELSVGKQAVAIYGEADGTGVASSAGASSYMAISEALERWAYLAVQDSDAAATYGFDIDRSSNGMAAFPGLFRRQAQVFARGEAIARHTLVSWWDGRLPAERTPTPFAGVEAVRIHHSAGPGEVVIVFRRTRAGYAYGHAYGGNMQQALQKAVIGLARAEHVLTAHRAKGALAAPGNFLERRALFFASEEGAELFGRRLLARQEKPSRAFLPFFDGEIPGPWARWATVWRCCVHMPTADYLDPDTSFFFW
jgi:hypothetical protein